MNHVHLFTPARLSLDMHQAGAQWDMLTSIGLPPHGIRNRCWLIEKSGSHVSTREHKQLRRLLMCALERRAYRHHIGQSDF